MGLRAVAQKSLAYLQSIFVLKAGDTMTGALTWSLGASNTAKISQAGAGLTTYNYFSLNGVVTSSGGIGMFGGDASDTALYLNSPVSVNARIGTAVTFQAAAVGCTLNGATAVPAGGTAGLGYKFSSTANLGVFFGSGAPTLSAAWGSLYIRTDGSTTNDRMYVNTNGTTGWTAVITAT